MSASVPGVRRGPKPAGVRRLRPPQRHDALASSTSLCCHSTVIRRPGIRLRARRLGTWQAGPRVQRVAKRADRAALLPKTAYQWDRCFRRPDSRTCFPGRPADVLGTWLLRREERRFKNRPRLFATCCGCFPALACGRYPRPSATRRRCVASLLLPGLGNRDRARAQPPPDVSGSGLRPPAIPLLSTPGCRWTRILSGAPGWAFFPRPPASPPPSTYGGKRVVTLPGRPWVPRLLRLFVSSLPRPSVRAWGRCSSHMPRPHRPRPPIARRPGLTALWGRPGPWGSADRAVPASPPGGKDLTAPQTAA